jgi:transcriptional regulator with XRE-family HTH domain
MTKLGARIKKAREARGWSQRELDRQAKITLGHVAAIETRGVRPRIDTLVKIAKALDLGIEALA